MKAPKVYAVGGVTARLEEGEDGDLILTLMEPDYADGSAVVVTVCGQQAIASLQIIAQDARLWPVSVKNGS